MRGPSRLPQQVGATPSLVGVLPCATASPTLPTGKATASYGVVAAPQLPPALQVHPPPPHAHAHAPHTLPTPIPPPPTPEGHASAQAGARAAAARAPHVGHSIGVAVLRARAEGVGVRSPTVCQTTPRVCAYLSHPAICYRPHPPPAHLLARLPHLQPVVPRVACRRSPRGADGGCNAGIGSACRQRMGAV